MHHTNGRDGWRWDDFAATLGETLTELLDEPVTELTPATHLLDDVGLDSFTILLLRDQLEERYAVRLPPTEVEPTAGHLFDLLTARVGD